MAGIVEFRDDDDGYLAWISANADGYVVNIPRNHNTTYARLHHARCWTISGRIPRGGTWTGPYVKVCAEGVVDLEQWAIDPVRQQISVCGSCRPAADVSGSRPEAQVERMESSGAAAAAWDGGQGSDAQSSEAGPEVVTASTPGRYVVRGPGADRRAVEVWADDYIRFGRRPVWQEHLRNEIRTRCRQLIPPVNQVLSATFFGPKLPNADIENIALYNIDSFKAPGRNGIRFEHGAGVPSAPDGANYPFSYRYSLAPRSVAFTHWQRERTLASFDWTDLGAFGGVKKLAQVWLALARTPVELAEVARAAEAPFAVRVQVCPPQGVQPVWGALVKGIFDGVIAAFQANSNTTGLGDTVARISTTVPADVAEIEQHLLDQRRAVLGVVPRLVSAYRNDVKWNPSDQWCVAGELLASEPVGPHWAIKGEVIEVSRVSTEDGSR